MWLPRGGCWSGPCRRRGPKTLDLAPASSESLDRFPRTDSSRPYFERNRMFVPLIFLSRTRDVAGMFCRRLLCADEQASVAPVQFHRSPMQLPTAPVELQHAAPAPKRLA
jgi:hypothetical protein